MTFVEQAHLVESKLGDSPGDWRRKVFRLILCIPPGHLISYGNLARWANREDGLHLQSRNTAWLRGSFYSTMFSQTRRTAPLFSMPLFTLALCLATPRSLPASLADFSTA